MYFGQEDFLARWRNYQAHIAQWQQQYPKLASIDLRYDREVVLKMAADPAAPSAAPKPPPKPEPAAAQPAAHKAPPQHSTAHKTKPAQHTPPAKAHTSPPPHDQTGGQMRQQDNIIAVLDAGSRKIRVLIAEVHEGALRYRGHGICDAAGMRKGLISDLAPAAAAIDRAAVMAESSGTSRHRATSSSPSAARTSAASTAAAASVSAPACAKLRKDDVRAAVDRARSIALPADREILHLLPQQFILDEQPGIHDPVGMVGNRLEVNLHIATSSASAQQSIVTCVNKAGLEVTETVFEALAAAEATLGCR